MRNNEKKETTCINKLIPAEIAEAMVYEMKDGCRDSIFQGVHVTFATENSYILFVDFFFYNFCAASVVMGIHALSYQL